MTISGWDEGLAHTETRHYLSEANGMIYLLAHLRCNDRVAVAFSGILHKLLPVASSCAHNKGYIIASIECHIVCSEHCSLSEVLHCRADNGGCRLNVSYKPLHSFKDMQK